MPIGPWTFARSSWPAIASTRVNNSWKVYVEGANEAKYNGRFMVTSVPNANTFTYEVTGAPASPGTGMMITAAEAAMMIKIGSGDTGHTLVGVALYLVVVALERRLVGAR